MHKNLFIEPIGPILALVTLVVCWWLFTSDTAMALSSFVAALMTSALVWISYIIIRWFILATRE